MTRVCFRVTAFVTILALAAPAWALRAQAGLESEKTRTTLTATLTGLEESSSFQPAVVATVRTAYFEQVLATEDASQSARLVNFRETPWTTLFRDALKRLVVRRHALAAAYVAAGVPDGEAVRQTITAWVAFRNAAPNRRLIPAILRQSFSGVILLSAPRPTAKLLSEQDQLAAALAAARTGLEEPTLEQVQQALAPLDGLQWRDSRAPRRYSADLFAGDVLAAAPVLHQMVARLIGPTPIAIVTSGEQATALRALQFPPAQIIGLVYGTTEASQGALVAAYEAQQIRFYHTSGRTAQQAINFALGYGRTDPQLTGLISLPINHVISQSDIALAYLKTQPLEWPGHAGEPVPSNLLSERITTAYDLTARYL